MTLELPPTTTFNSNTELPSKRERKRKTFYDDSEYAQKKTRTNWSQFQTLKLTELLATEFPNDTTHTMFEQGKWKILTDKLEEIDGFDKTSLQIRRKTFCLLKKENCTDQPFKKLLQQINSQEELTATSSVKEASPSKDEVIQNKLKTFSVALSRGYMNGIATFNKKLSQKPNIVPSTHTLNFDSPKTYDHPMEQQFYYLGRQCAFQRAREAFLQTTTIKTLYPFKSENTFNITTEIYLKIVERAKRICSVDLYSIDIAPVTPLFFKNLHQEGFKESINTQAYKLLMNNAIHQINLKIMRQSIQSSSSTSNSSLDYSSHQTTPLEEEHNSESSQCPHHQEKESDSFACKNFTEEEINFVLAQLEN